MGLLYQLISYLLVTCFLIFAALCVGEPEKKAGDNIKMLLFVCIGSLAECALAALTLAHQNFSSYHEILVWSVRFTVPVTGGADGDVIGIGYNGIVILQLLTPIIVIAARLLFSRKGTARSRATS
jgi:hypothetical protein